MTVSENLTDAHLECPLFTFSLPVIPITSALPARQVCRPVVSAGKSVAGAGRPRAAYKRVHTAAFPLIMNQFTGIWGQKGPLLSIFPQKRSSGTHFCPPNSVGRALRTIPKGLQPRQFKRNLW